jgi:hypothetical protein
MFIVTDAFVGVHSQPQSLAIYDSNIVFQWEEWLHKDHTHYKSLRQQPQVNHAQVGFKLSQVAFFFFFFIFFFPISWNNML